VGHCFIGQLLAVSCQLSALLDSGKSLRILSLDFQSGKRDSSQQPAVSNQQSASHRNDLLKAEG
jgi:hypothetical protein